MLVSEMAPSTTSSPAGMASLQPRLSVSSGRAKNQRCRLSSVPMRIFRLLLMLPVCLLYNTMIIAISNPKESQSQVHSFPPHTEVVIGRNPKSQTAQTLTVQEPLASRTHLAVRLDSGRVLIKDLGSSNGTEVAGRPISKQQWVAVQPGQQIRLGASTQAIFIKAAKPQPSESDSEGESSSRSREKTKPPQFQALCKQLKISDSSGKMLKQMTSERKSKEERIKFLKLMGCKNIQENWPAIELSLKSQNKYSNNLKKTTEELERQFEYSRGQHEKKGLGRR